MTTITYQAGAPVLRGGQPGENLSVSVADATVVVNDATTPGLVLLDLIYTQSSPSQTTTNFAVHGQSVPAATPAYSSATPAVCTVDGAGNVSWVSNGTCVVDTIVGREGYRVSRNISRTSGTLNTPTGFGAGSLAAHIKDNINAIVSGQTASDTTRNVFNGATRSTTRVGQAWDLSASSYTSSTDPVKYPVHLVSPRHVVMAAHIGTGVGASVSFRRNDNTTQTTIVDAFIDLGNDMRVALLRDAITGITPYYFLPSSFDDYLPCLGARNTVATFPKLPILNIECWSGVPKLRVLEASKAETAQASTAYASWSNDIANGDSSGPLILPITSSGNKSVLLGSMWSTSANPQYHRVLPAIQSAMNTLLAGHTLQTVSLSGLFTAF